MSILGGISVLVTISVLNGLNGGRQGGQRREIYLVVRGDHHLKGRGCVLSIRLVIYIRIQVDESGNASTRCSDGGRMSIERVQDHDEKQPNHHRCPRGRNRSGGDTRTSSN